MGSTNEHDPYESLSVLDYDCVKLPTSLHFPRAQDQVGGSYRTTDCDCLLIPSGVGLPEVLQYGKQFSGGSLPNWQTGVQALPQLMF